MIQKTVLLVVGVVLLISGMANDPRAAWAYWIIWLGTTLGYLLLERTGDSLDWILLAFCWIVAIVATAQVVGYWLGLRNDGFASWRPSSFVNSCNILGEIMVWGIVLAWKIGRRESLICFGVVLIASGSRISYLAFVAVMAVYIWNKNGILIHILPVIVLASVVLVYFGSVAFGRMNIVSRLSPWIGSAIQGGGLVGYGPGHLQEYLPAVTIHHNWHAHNVLLQAWGDTGVLGVLAVISLLVAIMRDAFLLRSMWLWMFVFATLVAGVFEYLYWLPGVGLLALLFYRSLSNPTPCTPPLVGVGDIVARA